MNTKKITLHVWCLFLFLTGMAQRYVGYLDLDYTKIDYNSSIKKAPKVIHPCFIKDSSGWRKFTAGDYDAFVRMKRYWLYYNGRQERSSFVKPRYDTTGITVLDVRQDRLPKAGKEAYGYHTFEDIKTSPPLLAIPNTLRNQQDKIQKIATGLYVQHWIEHYLEEKAIQLQLGRLPVYPPVDTIKNCWQVNDSVYIVQADLNLHIYCILDSIPFSEVDTHEWTNIEKMSVGDAPGEVDMPGKENQEQLEIIDSGGNVTVPFNSKYIYVAAESRLRKRWKSKNCFFIRVGNALRFIGHTLHFTDQADLDRDGCDELVFRKQGSSYISYILITNQFQTQLEHRVIQWW